MAFPQRRGFRTWVNRDLGSPGGAPVNEGALSASATSTASFVGASAVASTLSVAGLAAVLWVSSPTGVLVSSGAGTAAWTGNSARTATWSCAGTGAMSAVGSSIADSVWSASGTGGGTFTDSSSPAAPATFGDLTTLFCGYMADIRDNNPTRRDTDTLIVKAQPTVRNTTNSPDDLNTAYAEHLS